MKLFLWLCILLVSIPVASKAATDPCANMQGFDYCNCLMYPNGVGAEPAAAIAAPMFSCFTDTTKVAASATATAYPRGLIPYVTYKGMKDSTLSTVFKDIIITMMSLAVAFWGLRVFLGQAQNVKSESIYLMFKVAAVYYFYANAPELYNSMLGAIQQLTDIATTSLTGLRNSVGGNTGFWNNCAMDVAGTPTSAAPVTTIEMWQMWDCALNYLVGLSRTNSVAVFSGIIGVAMLFSATLPAGIMILMLVAYFLINLFGLMMKFLQTYILSVMALSFMFIIGYIIVPLVVFRGTYQFFHKWVSMCINYILTPVMILSYMCFALVAIDTAIFTGDNSVFEKLKLNSKSETYTQNGSNNPLLDIYAKRTDQFFVAASVDHANNSYTSCQGAPTDTGRNSTQTSGTTAQTSQPATTANVGLEFRKLYLTPCDKTFNYTDPATGASSMIPDPVNPVPPGCTPIPAGVTAPTGVADAYGMGGADTWKYVSGVLIACAVAALLIYILNIVFNAMPSLVNGLISQGFRGGSMIGAKVPMQEQMDKLIGGNLKSMMDKSGNLSNAISKMATQIGLRKTP